MAQGTGHSEWSTSTGQWTKAFILLKNVDTLDEEGQHEGSLMKEIRVPGVHAAETKVLHPLEDPSRVITVRPFHVAEVLHRDIPYLLAVPENKRINFFMDKIRLDDAVSLEVGASVVVIGKPGIGFAKGTVRYKGELTTKKGIWFGAELAPQLAGEGSTDGTFKNIPYFSCEEDCGVFLRPTQIRPAEPKLDPNLEIGERVVLMVDDGQQRATVKWIGFLPEDNSREMSDLKVGVDFDDPVGSGTGRFKTKQLFMTKKRHASIVHIMGLIKASDIDDNITESRPTSSHEPAIYNVTQGTEPQAEARREDFWEPITVYPERRSETKNRADPARFGRTESDSHAPEMDAFRRKLESAKSQRDALVSREASNAEDKPIVIHDPFSGHGIPLKQHTTLGIGSRVEVFTNPPAYGTIRWIGTFPKVTRSIAGVEMDVANRQSYTCGSFGNKPYFECKPYTAFFINIEKLKPCQEKKQAEYPVVDIEVCEEQKFGSVTGMYKGIQGDTNSCYMDATLFALFRFTSILDDILKPTEEPGDSDVSKVRSLLANIVSELRQNSFVPQDRIAPFRRTMSTLFPEEGFRSKERDPEEFLTCLLKKLLQVPPFLYLSNELDTHIYQLLVDKVDNLSSPSTQQLLHASFRQFDLKLARVPSLLLVLMPRFGKSYRMYDHVLPSPLLDITDLLKDYPRTCGVCKQPASVECLDCYDPLSKSLETITFCGSCFEDKHQKHSPNHLNVNKLSVHPEPSAAREPPRRQILELFAVLCIDTSHYVAFTKSQFGQDTSWVFFDSMADRRGWAESAHNVPQVLSCPEVDVWFSRENPDCALPTEPQQKGKVERMLSDAYLCMYQTPEKLHTAVPNGN